MHTPTSFSHNDSIITIFSGNAIFSNDYIIAILSGSHCSVSG